MTLEAAFSAWIAYLEELGFSAQHFLNPPATEAALMEAERQVGFRLPDEFRALYRVADGQIDPFTIDDPAPGTIVAPLFGGYDFVPLAKAVQSYLDWKVIRDDAGDKFASNFNESGVATRGDDPVHAEYWRPGWLPFSADGGGNSYAVDCDPAPGGSYGQVIVIGPDEDLRRVLAPSLAAFLADATARRPQLDRSMGEAPIFMFEMEDR